MADEDLTVNFRFDGGDGGQPPGGNQPPAGGGDTPQPPGDDTPGLKEKDLGDLIAEANEGIKDAAEIHKNAADRWEATANSLFDEAGALYTREKVLNARNFGDGYEEALAAAQNPDVSPRPSSDLAAVVSAISDGNRDLIDAVENLTDAVEEGSPVSPDYRPAQESSSQGEGASRGVLGDFIKKIIRPLAQASFTPTLFRNNLERTSLEGLRQATTLPSRVTAGIAALGPKFSGLAAVTGAVTGALVAVPAATALVVTSIVAGAKAIGVTAERISRDIARFSPNIVSANAQNRLSEIQARQEQAERIGPEIASLLTGNQSLNNELRRLISNAVEWLDGPGLVVIDLATSILDAVNDALEYLGRSADSNEALLREARKEALKRIREKAEEIGLGPFALQLAAQADPILAKRFNSAFENLPPLPPRGGR